jgi:heme oxygenase
MNLSPFQQKIKESTQQIHSEAEQHPLMQSFINGTYTKEHLLQFLINILPIYSVVEQRLLQENIKELPGLKRTELIEKDINSLIPEVITNLKNVYLLTPLDCTCAWVSNCWKKPIDLLKAEFYSGWLADFYGGRMLTKTVIPHAMYTCNDYGTTITAIRNKLDQPLIDSNITEEDIIQEILSFFEFHLELFDEIYNGNTQQN